MPKIRMVHSDCKNYAYDTQSGWETCDKNTPPTEFDCLNCKDYNSRHEPQSVSLQPETPIKRGSGRDMVKKTFNDWALGTMWICPECKNTQEKMTNYCPECGRQMIYEKEVEEES